MSPQEKWEALKYELLGRIGDIDRETTWSNVVPPWWLEMCNVRAIAASPDVYKIAHKD